MLGRIGLALLRLIKADAPVVAAATGGLQVLSGRDEKVLFASLVQLDGDIVTFVAADCGEEPELAAQHFAKVDREVRRLLGSLDRLRASLIATLALLLGLLNLPALTRADREALAALLAEALAIAAALLVPVIRRTLSAWFLGGLLRWLMRAYGRKLLRRVTG